MKNGMLWSLALGLVVVTLLVVGATPQESSNQATNTPPALEPEVNTEAVAEVTTNQVTALGEQTAEADLSQAEFKPISTEKPLPPNIKPAGPVSEVIKLADSGVDESVMMTFVTNSTSLFNLGVEEIIYLNDIGVPGLVVAAMIQRDQALKGLSANAAPVAAAPASGAPTSQAGPEPGNPELYAPQPVAAAAPPETAPEAPPPGEYATGSDQPPPGADTGYSTFYSSLAPYGTWVDVAGYGACWQPTVVVVNRGWRPYCNGGRWVYSDCGWYWSSGYSWGWAPFHYGRWFCHQRIGWCWAPGTVWGPSWVSWRYTGSHCGWAPLPPAAGYRVGVGLTFHGQGVNGAFAFGLGVNSYSFVNVSHFSNPHLNRYALPHDQATQIYNQTVASTTITASNNRVSNHGIPPSRVAAATKTEIHPIAIREVNTTARQGARGERFDSTSGTLSVYRPHFPQSTGTQPAPGGRPQPGSGGNPRPEVRNGSSGAVVTTTPAPTAPRVAAGPPARTFGGTTTTQPNINSHLGRTAGRPATGVTAAPTPATASVPAPVRGTSDPATKPTAPILPQGPDRSSQTTAGRSPAAINQATPSSSLVVIGKREGSGRQPVSRPSAPATEAPRSWTTAPRQDTPSRPVVNPTPQPIVTPGVTAPAQPRWSTPPAAVPRSASAAAPETARSRPTTPRQDALSHPTVNQRPQPATSPAWPPRAPSGSVGSAPRATAPPVRSEAPRQYTAPSYQPPAPAPRVAVAPAPGPQQMRSFSPPAVSSPPRAQPTESRPASSAPSAPAAAPPAARANPSSGRNSR